MAEMYQPTTCEEKAFAEEEDEDAGEKGTNTVEAIGEKGDAADEEKGGWRHALDGDGDVEEAQIWPDLDASGQIQGFIVVSVASDEEDAQFRIPSPVTTTTLQFGGGRH